MAKTKTKKARGSQPRKGKTKERHRGNGLAVRYAQLLHNPDNGDHMFDVYDGERGETQKFVSTITLNTTSGHTSGFLHMFGATGNGQWQSAASSGTALSTSVSNVGYPGAVFLGANANKTRCKALKLELIPSAASFSTITGEVAAGVSTGAFFATGVTTVDNIFDIAKAYGPIRREAIVSRWIPSGLDHTYAAYNVAPDEDHNTVFIAYRGWPAGVQISVRITYVVEYTIKNTVGIPPTGAVSVPLGHQHVLAAMQTRDPHWHHSILDEVKRAGVGIARDVGNFGRHMARNGMVNLAEKVFARSAAGAIMLA